MITPQSLHHTQRQALSALAKGARRAFCLLAAAAMFTSAAIAGPEVAPDPKAVKTESKPAGSRFSGLLNVDISDQYITPRGLNIENEGVVIQPMLILFLNAYKSSDPNAFINDVTLFMGNWNSVHTHAAGPTPGNWNETDPFWGISTTFAKDFRFDITGTMFISGVNAFDTSSNLSLKLSYMDKFLPEGWSLNPSIECFIELTEKATIVLNEATSDQGFYFAFAIEPTYKFKDIPLIISLPTFFNVCDDSFYQKLDGSGGGAGVALVSTAFQVRVPLTCIPENYGKWSIYAKYQYYHLFNQGVLDGNFMFGGNSGEYHEDMGQVRGGVTLAF